jgi:PEP-CTERM motif
LTALATSSASSAGSVSPATATYPAPSGTFAYVYNASNGDVTILYNGFTGFAGKPAVDGTHQIDYLDLRSASGILIAANINSATAGGTTGTPRDNTEIKLVGSGSFVFPDRADLGRILPAGLDPANLLANDLTLTVDYNASGVLNTDPSIVGNSGLATPEPATLSLLGLAVLGLMSRRRKNKAAEATTPAGHSAE